MKTISFIKNNAMALIALATIIGFSAFRVVENQSATLVDNWYEVEEDGSINPNGQSTPPNDCPTEGEEYCAVQITVNPGQPFPEDVEQALEMQGESKLTIHDDRFRD